MFETLKSYKNNQFKKIFFQKDHFLNRSGSSSAKKVGSSAGLRYSTLKIHKDKKFAN